MTELLALPAAAAATAPFPHIELTGVISADMADAALTWLEQDYLWRLRVEDFYEQHEFSLLSSPPPPALAVLTGPELILQMGKWLRETFAVAGNLELVDVSAHRLTAGQTIRIHNDYLGGAETHRVLIQLNRGWTQDLGGILLLFRDEDPQSLDRALLPVHGDGLAFEISPDSYHAVSTIHGGARYTLVYTWRTADHMG